MPNATQPNVTAFTHSIALTDDDIFEIRIALLCRILQCSRVADQQLAEGNAHVADAWEGRAVALASIIERLTVSL